MYPLAGGGRLGGGDHSQIRASPDHGQVVRPGGQPSDPDARQVDAIQGRQRVGRDRGRAGRAVGHRRNTQDDVVAKNRSVAAVRARDEEQDGRRGQTKPGNWSPQAEAAHAQYRRSAHPATCSAQQLVRGLRRRERGQSEYLDDKNVQFSKLV